VSSGLVGAEAELLPGYREILAHAELELELAGSGDLDALDALGARWEELLSALGEQPPAEAAPILARARLLHERTRIELIRLRERLLGDVATLSRARRTAESYGGQLQGRGRLDRSA
jgi:hypothetical protein